MWILPSVLTDSYRDKNLLRNILSSEDRDTAVSAKNSDLFRYPENINHFYYPHYFSEYVNHHTENSFRSLRNFNSFTSASDSVRNAVHYSLFNKYPSGIPLSFSGNLQEAFPLPAPPGDFTDNASFQKISSLTNILNRSFNQGLYKNIFSQGHMTTDRFLNYHSSALYPDYSSVNDDIISEISTESAFNEIQSGYSNSFFNDISNADSFIQNKNTSPVNISVNLGGINQQITSQSDADYFIDRLASDLAEAFISSAEGVY